MPVQPLLRSLRTARSLGDAPATAVYSKVVQHYNVGEAAPLSVSWHDGVGAPAVPSTVTCVVRHPDGTETTLAVTAAGGAFLATAEPDAPGQWWYGFAASGGFQGYMEHLFVVRDRRV